MNQTRPWLKSFFLILSLTALTAVKPIDIRPAMKSSPEGGTPAQAQIPDPYFGFGPPSKNPVDYERNTAQGGASSPRWYAGGSTMPASPSGSSASLLSQSELARSGDWFGGLLNGFLGTLCK